MLARLIPAVEVLGATTVLAVDKTGTLTQSRMQVAELDADGAVFDAAAAAPLPAAFHRLMVFAMLATPPDPFDPMERAIQDFWRTQLAGTEHVHDDSTPEFQYPLDSAILANMRGNPLLSRMFGGVALVLAAVLTITPLRELMGFGLVGLPPLVAAAALLLACGLWLQALHWVDARTPRVPGAA